MKNFMQTFEEEPLLRMTCQSRNKSSSWPWIRTKPGSAPTSRVRNNDAAGSYEALGMPVSSGGRCVPLRMLISLSIARNCGLPRGSTSWASWGLLLAASICTSDDGTIVDVEEAAADGIGVCTEGTEETPFAILDIAPNSCSWRSISNSLIPCKLALPGL